MTQFFSTLSVLIGLTYMSWADQKIEQKLRFISLRDNVNVVVGELNERVDFVNVEGSDYVGIDNRLAAYKVSRISPAFLSKDGRFIITFVKSDDETIKRVIFVKDYSAPVADNVVGFDQKSIRTTRGFLASTNEIFDSAKAARSQLLK